MSSTKEFPFNKSRRITPKELKEAKAAIEEVTGKKRKTRGRPPKKVSEKFKPVSIRLHPKILQWAKKQAHKRGVGYQTIINEILLKEVA